MSPKQNPTASGSRVPWNSLVGASKESLTLSAYRAQHLIDNCGIHAELAAMLAAFVFGGGVHG